MKKIFLNKRKKNFFSLKLLIYLSLFFTLVFFFYSNLSNKKILYFFIDSINYYSKVYDYTLSNININKLEFVEKKEILKIIEPYRNKSIFLLPINKLADEILQHIWIRNIIITSDYKQSIKIKVEEEVPIGIYYNKDQKFLFNQDLKILDKIYDKNNTFNKLIIFYGLNSIYESVNLINKIGIKFKDDVKEAYFISNRRWDLKLNNNIILKLPEKDIVSAIDRYTQIYSNFSNIEMNNIEIIDLRINKKAIIRYK